jgi:predicted Zn-dependent protease
MGADGNFNIEQDEARLWKRSKELQELLSKSGFIYEDDELVSYLNGVLHRLVGDLEAANNVNLKVYIIKDPFFNAFCMPDGTIYIHTGVLANMDNEAQLATLLGHEATHFFHRHSLRFFRSVINKAAFLSVWDVILVGASNVYGGTADLVRLFGEYAVIGSFYGYSRAIEKEADESAFELVRKAGYNPLEAKRFMENLYEATKDDKKVPYFYSSHPRTKVRIKDFDRLIRGLSKTSGDDIRGVENSDIYNKMIKGLLLDNAQLDIKRNKLELAKKQVKRYNQLCPGDSRGYYLAGKIYALEGESEKARELLMKSIELDPRYPDSHRELGMLYYKQKYTQKAER